MYECSKEFRFYPHSDLKLIDWNFKFSLWYMESSGWVTKFFQWNIVLNNLMNNNDYLWCLWIWHPFQIWSTGLSNILTWNLFCSRVAGKEAGMLGRCTYWIFGSVTRQIELSSSFIFYENEKKKHRERGNTYWFGRPAAHNVELRWGHLHWSTARKENSWC